MAAAKARPLCFTLLYFTLPTADYMKRQTPMPMPMQGGLLAMTALRALSRANLSCAQSRCVLVCCTGFNQTPSKQD